ncbi:efflux RND transporter periplasmic adaptor subunit [Methylosinus sp. Sm6]|uniref:efflux RND transporter periplasmic adaptor subunit n=1 Tax=Methylosinus sp. Sm6 TaxID=2866948 RepID=UPI001C99C28A|nr:efflux RND transporter periplasmic adaptor subunit [Methylosinus sp. Sm6]MBY6241381.1 efflux RND transporter periplasmic adaptor subunit [Methylosinus sp. Sm6]
MRDLSFFMIGCLLAVAGALAGCNEPSGRSSAPRPRVVLVAPVHFTPLTPPRRFVATIRPRVETDQGFRVAGKVMRRLVENGQRVRAGDALALLDETDLRLQREQADAELAAARMALEQAGADERRAQKLRKDGWTPQAALDRQRAAAEEARGRERRALRAVELAANALDYASLRAEADGVVTAALVEPGQVVAAGQPALRIARSGELEALVALPEAFAALAGAGEARLTLWSLPDKTYPARLRELGAAADPATKTFAARFSIEGADAAVAIGMSATLSIESRGGGSAASVPLAALFDQGQGPNVWKVEDDGRLTLRPVEVLRYEARTALLAQGVAEGDRVVALGAHKLDAGEKVRPVAADAL